MRKTKTLQQIEDLYHKQQLDFLPIYERAKALLEVYRNVVWSLKNKADFMVCETQATYGKDLDEALIYLSTFASDFKRQDFESKVSHLFESKWLIGLVDKALYKIKDYPEYGEVYSAILFQCYLSKVKIKDQECMRQVSLERSCYYQRKREAISLLGVSLWGFELPKVLKQLKEDNLIKDTEKRGMKIPVYTTEQLTRIIEQENAKELSNV